MKWLNGFMFLGVVGLVLVSCDAEVTPIAGSCNENDKTDYKSFVESSRNVANEYNALSSSAFVLDDWATEKAVLADIADESETARVNLETFCQEIQDAMVNTILEDPNLQTNMQTNEIIDHFGITMTNEHDVSAFAAGSLNGAVKVGDTVVPYIGEEHLPFTKLFKIAQYNEDISERLGSNYVLHIRPTLHYCAIDAFPVLIALQMEKARNEKEEALDFLARIESVMVEFEKYMVAIPSDL